MSDLLHQQWQGTDAQARQEALRGKGYWLATPWPRSELVFAALMAVGGVAISVGTSGHYHAAAFGFAAFFLVLAALMCVPAVWTLRHPDAAARHLAASRSYNKTRWRKHPVTLAVLIVVGGFVNGFVRFNDHGVGGRLIAGAASAGFGLVISVGLILHSRRKLAA